MNRPLTKKEWLEFLEKACDEFDWSATHQQREWVGLTDETQPKPFGYFQYDIRLDAWVQNKAADKGIPFYTHPREWVGLMRGVRVDGDTVIIKVKGNEEARVLSDELINQMEMLRGTK